MKEVAKARLYSLQGPIDFINGPAPSPPYNPLSAAPPPRGRGGDTADSRTHGRGGSIPQPHQELPSIDPTEVGGGAVVGAEVIPQPVLLRSVCRLVPMNGPVVGVGDGGDLIGEGHEVPCGCECIVAGQAAKRSA